MAHPCFGWEKVIFDKLVYTVPIKDMLDQGFLVPPTTVPQDQRIDTSKLKVSRATGDFTERALAEVSNDDAINIPAVEATIEELKSRNSCLVFCTTIEHAQRVCDLFNQYGEKAEVVHSKIKKGERKRIIDQFKSGVFRVLVNPVLLTVGFDHRPLDLITVLRPTAAKGLWVQLLGRGMRISPETGKVDCRVLDFTSTSEEMPPLDLIEAPPPPKLTAKRESELGNLKECQQCQALIPLQARECPACGFQLPSSADSGPDIRDEASDAILLSTQSAPERLFRCTGWMTGIHTKIGKPTSLRVDYYDGMKTRASEWICFNHIGAPRVRATRWWLWMGGQNPPPESTEAAYERRDELTRPSAIKVRKDGKYDRVIGVSFGEVSEGAQTPLPN